ncbi:MAG: hypothetical protein GYA63_10295 [Armatimonadetes bacterium]|jgi:hypothetical protein|nr:hypothetical protein [Armatimonadota bacterium]
MKNRMRLVRWIAVIAAAAVVSQPVAVQAQNLRKVIVGGGIAVAVTKFGPQVNKFVNDLTNHKDTTAIKTKVVPIVSVGSGGYVGAVQVMGTAKDVDRTKAVVQLEGRFNDFRIKALVPVGTTTATKNPDRIPNVGVSALLDYKL